MLEIDGEAFETGLAHFAFSTYHRIADMDELAKLSQLTHITTASFAGTNLDDRGLAHIAAVPALENLNLQDTQITNDGLVHLARLPRLAHLRLKDNPQLTNACVPHILELRALIDLQLHETSIDQRGVDELTPLTRLRDLCVYVTHDNYSFEALCTLSARMPWCRILAKGRGEFHSGKFDGAWR